MKTTICIPCYKDHYAHMQELIDAYHAQTVLPDEIVISVSEVDSVTPLKSNIPVKVLFTQERAFAGKNRNITASNSSGDLLIFNDADDIPAYKRVAIIKGLFEQDNNLTMAVHNIIWNLETQKFLDQTKDITEVKYKPLDLRGGPYANGPVSIKKTLFEKVQWNPDRPKAQDVEFVSAAYNYCKDNGLNMIHIMEPIYLYRNKLSSKIETKL